MRRGDHQGAPIAFVVHDGGSRDRHDGLAGSHLAVENGSGRIVIDEQARHRLHALALRFERRTQQPVHHGVALRIALTVIHRWVLAAHGGEQIGAEITDEIGQGDVQAGQRLRRFFYQRLGRGAGLVLFYDFNIGIVQHGVTPLR